MTELIRSQSEIFLVMGACGLAAGMIQDVFQRFTEIVNPPAAGKVFIELFSWISVGFMISEFFFWCDNGKITFEGIVSFLLGLWLWKRFFCDILTPAGGRNEREKGTNKHIRSKRN